ncbi:MAG: SDR family NAD(P)-dependent oxidoreductase [Alphaproteobacteria bacterium]|uniref:SDR family NAD(P)-dependent oxidoreductase n=1 Tax=Candidatus Nitrobium versatile TaxID=2884831 RepID=A0A953LVE7_9BACT|nr:SDR family NAD(P)-dependent oxidoreductase [Candidatus Nitrobium versatile]
METGSLKELVAIDRGRIGEEIYRLIVSLYPFCRSITGNGVRRTLALIGERIPLTVHEVPSGTKVFDWTVPPEWNIRDAYVKNAAGERVVDFGESNLHVLSYSTPVHATVSLQELREHLFTLPEYPDWIPYRTSYYRQNWGFCMSHARSLELGEGEYEVCIDASLEKGSLTYGECFIEGREPHEIVLSCHVCHPSLCNDNLSGVAVAAVLAAYLARLPLRYSYRFLFLPGTIGSITWLALNERNLSRVRHGLVLAGVGDAGGFTYKRSRRGDAEIDRAMVQALKDSGEEYAVVDFSPVGYDERQYCSPGINLPVGCLMRTPHGCYPEYHTSADNPGLVRPGSLAGAFALCASLLRVLEEDGRYISLSPKGEPQLGRRGLYPSTGGQGERKARELALMWVLNLSDGTLSLRGIAERSGLPFPMVRDAADLLQEHGLLREYPAQTPSRGETLQTGTEEGMASLKDKVAVITGASRGIGRAIALSLAKEGMVLCLTGRDAHALKEVAELARPMAAAVHCYQTDLTDEEEIRSFEQSIVRDLGRVHILIHSAGVFSMGLLEHSPVEELDRHYRVNVRAPYLLTQILLPLIKADRGQVVFINSSVAFGAKAAVSQYAAAKHALKAIADSLRAEVNASGVRVLSVYPGRTATPMQAAIHEEEGRTYRPERLLQPGDVAAVVVNALRLERTAELTDISMRPLSKLE